MSTQKLGSVTLPPINTGRNHGGASPGQINGIITNRANAHQLIYRSVPPKNSGESFSDMLGGSPMGKYGKQSIVSSNSPLEYAERFKAKPMTKPNLVQFTTGELDKVKRHSNSMRTSRRKIEGFFPPMKLRQNGKPLSPDMETTLATKMELAPSAYSDIRSKSERGFMSNSPFFRRTPDSYRTLHTYPDNNIVYPSVISEQEGEYDDLSLLPPPKKLLPKRELPWVFRYKVKRNMNELAKIMASKPPAIPNTDSSTT